MKKILVCLAVALTVSVASYAQSPVQFGVQAGLNLSNVSFGGDLDNAFGDISSKIGFNVGVTADYALSEALFLQPALLYTVKGASFEDDVTATLSYLELPINIGYKIPLESFTISLKAGPYLAYGLSAKLKGEDDGDTAEIDLYKKRDEFGGDPLLKKFDYGLGIGAGIEFGQIGIGITYELGLANLNATEADGSIKNQNAFLSVGYKF